MPDESTRGTLPSTESDVTVGARETAPRRTDILVALAIAVLWQATATIVGAVASHLLAGPTPPPPGLLGHTFRWDGGWYVGVANGAYSTDRAAPAFYPLYPLLLAGLHGVSAGHLSFITAAFVVNTLSLWLAVLGLQRIVLCLFPSRISAWSLTAMLLAFPSAFYMHFVYTEALFCALTFWAYLLALRGRWAGSAVILALATACRLPGLAVVLLCFLEYLRQRDWSPRRALSRELLWFGLAVSGLLSYATYLGVTLHDPLAMIHAYRIGWPFQRLNLNIPSMLLRFAKKAVEPPRTFDGFVHAGMPLIALAVLFVASAYLLLAVRGWALPPALFGFASLVLFTINDNPESAHRYVLPVVTIYLAAGAFVQRHRWATPLLQVLVVPLALMQSFLLVLFAIGFYLG